MSLDSNVIGKLTFQTQVESYALNNGWHKIKFNNQDAYISADYTIDVTDSVQGFIKGQRVNVRDLPSTQEGTVVEQLSRGAVKIVRKDDEWYYIRTDKGTEGYVFGEFVGLGVVVTKETVPEGFEVVMTNPAMSSDLISIAKSKLGSPYKWGQAGPNSFDCSGFIQYAFKEAYGIDLGHSSKAMSQTGTTINKADLLPGDLVFFTTDRSGTVNHVGIYIGEGDFIHASSSSYNGRQVHINPLDSGFYEEVYKWGKRIAIN